MTPSEKKWGGESVKTSCKSGMTVDDAVIAAVREHGDIYVVLVGLFGEH